MANEAESGRTALTTDEARAWLDSLNRDVGLPTSGTLSGKDREDFEKDVADLQKRHPEDLQKIQDSYVQKYAERSASGGDRSAGGYSTDLPDDPTRVYTRGQAADPGAPGTSGVAEVKGTYNAPAALGGYSNNVEERIRQHYRRFLDRTPEDSEVQAHLDAFNRRGYAPGWENRITSSFINSPEYLQKSATGIDALYQKYYRRNATDEEVVAHRANPSGLAGLENELARNPSDIYRLGNLTGGTPEVKEILRRNPTPEIKASWNKPAPVAPPNPPPPPPAAPPTPTPTPTPTPPAAARPTATPTPSAPVQPYSARATTPYTTAPSAVTGQVPMAGMPATGQVPMAGMPAASTNTMGNMLGSTQPQNPYALANAWNTTNANYRQAGDAYAAQQGGNYNPAPWSGTRLGAPRNALGTPTTVGSPNDVALATDAAERRRAYRFGMQNAQVNQANAAMGQQDFNGQMDNWLRAYNEWNRQGVDPMAIPGGVV